MAIYCRVSHLANHDVPQQAIHRESLLWRIVQNQNPFQLVKRRCQSQTRMDLAPSRFRLSLDPTERKPKWLFIFAPPCFSTACVENFSRFLPKMSCTSNGAADFSSANAWSCETQWIAFWLFWHLWKCCVCCVYEGTCYAILFVCILRIFRGQCG